RRHQGSRGHAARPTSCGSSVPISLLHVARPFIAHVRYYGGPGQRDCGPRSQSRVGSSAARDQPPRIGGRRGARPRRNNVPTTRLNAATPTDTVAYTAKLRDAPRRPIDAVIATTVFDAIRPTTKQASRITPATAPPARAAARKSRSCVGV